MATADPPLLVTLVTGESSIRFMRFSPGQVAATTISVGTDGNWPVSAVGVARAHVSLFFDGQQLFAGTAGPNLQAFINGSPIDNRWWPIRVPAELRFGQACLRVALDIELARPAPLAPGTAEGQPAPNPAAMTKLDGAAEWARRQSSAPADLSATRLYQPPVGGGRPGQLPSVPPGPAPVVRIAENVAHAKPAAIPPEEPGMVSTMRRPLGWKPPSPAPAAHPANAPHASTPPAANATHLSNPPARGAYPSAPPAKAPHPSNPPANVAYPSAPPPANVSANPRPNVPLHAMTAYAPLANVPLDARLPLATPAPPPPVQRAMPAPKPPAQDDPAVDAKPAKPLNVLVAAWRSTSLVKKATAVLLPVALIAMLLPEPAEQRPATAARPASSASKSSGAAASAVASATPSTSTPSTPVVIATEAEPAPPKPPAQASSPSAAVSLERPAVARAADAMERAAIDAAFEGRWPDALKLYDRLAAAHPDDATFGEAARILRETRLHQR